MLKLVPAVRRRPRFAPALLVASLIVVLRLPSLLEPHHYTDEGIFAAVAARLLDGHALYTGAWDDKPPLIFWLYAGVLAIAGPSMVALRLVATAWAAATGAGVVLLGSRVWSPRAGLSAGLLFAVLAGTPFIEGNLALTELFGAGPAMAAMLLIGRSSVAGRSLLAAGALLAIACLFKQVFALDAMAVGIFLLCGGRNGWRQVAWLAVGFSATVGLVAVPLLLSGAMGEAVHSVFSFYGGYFDEGVALPSIIRPLRLLPLALAFAAVMIGVLRRGRRPADLIVLWCGAALTGALLSLRPYGHYLVQAAAPVSLATASLFARSPADRRPSLALLPLVIAAPLIVAVFAPFWWSFPMVRAEYYRLTAGRFLRIDKADAAIRRFDQGLQAQQRAAQIVRASPDRSLFVWAEWPWLYPLAESEAPVRFTVAYHTAFVPGAKAETLAALQRRPPHYILWDHVEWRRLPGLEAFVAERYVQIERWDAVALYQRRDGD